MLDIVEEVPRKNGRRVVGHYCTLRDGEVVFLLRQRHGDIWRAGKATISGAMAEGTACWAVDERLLYDLRARKVRRIGVRVVENGDLYVGEVADFFDLRKARAKEPSPWGGPRKRCLPLDRFAVQKGRVDLSESCPALA